MTTENLLEWADIIDCIEAKTVAEADALFRASDLIRTMAAATGSRGAKLQILKRYDDNRPPLPHVRTPE